MTTQFVHLRLHSEFSLVDGLVRVKPLMAGVAERGMAAVAVTDQSNMCSLIRFYQSAQRTGVKPICGCDVWLETNDPAEPPTHSILLCMNEQGYRNLMEIVSSSYQTNQHQGRALVKRQWIMDKSEGLIVLSGASQGEIGQKLLAGNLEEAERLLKEWQAVLGDRFYLEIQRTDRVGDEDYLHAAVDLATRCQCAVVATNDVMFMNRSDFDAHEARFCIGESRVLDDPRRPRPYSEEQYFKTPQEMAERFSDIPEAITNTIEIAKRCSVNVPLGTHHLPEYPVLEYPVPEGKSMEQFFRKFSKDGLDERLKVILDKNDLEFETKRQVYYDRLNFELDIILQMGFPGYFMIVMDFIRWSKTNGIPVGPGRGSGAGSLVAYAQNITDLDPLEYDLLFERFLNPERVSMPDFDVDFCMEKRDKVIDYVSRTYGCDAVSQIITFGTMAAKAVVKDVARVQGKSYGMADRLSKLIPFEVGMTLKNAFDQEEGLREFLEHNEDAQEVWEMALKLEGITRNVGKHAGGVVIAPTKLTDFSPLYCDENGHGLVTQYDKNDVETAGLVKFDFLGLRTLTIVDWALKMINPTREKQGQPPIDIMKIDLTDTASYTLLKKAKTTAVFQLESRGMKDLVKRLQPDCFEDIIALVALFRPGPLQSGMVDNFINRKHGREKLSYPDAQYQHEWLKPILQPTYGIILYQEQVMQIARVLAGYTLGGADILRRAMGKKNLEEMAKQRSIFADGAKGQGIDPDLAMKIFDLVEKFAGYGFNKSHSAAYALVSYQTLWLKTHYPAEFMAAVMSSDMQNTDKVVTFIEECRNMGLTVLPPDVNSGSYMFGVNEEGCIDYGLGAIKGVGEGPIATIVEARQQSPFEDIFDFCQRIDSKKVNKRCLEALMRSGALDRQGPYPNEMKKLNFNRAVLDASMEKAGKAAEQSARSLDSGLGDLFGDLVSEKDVDVYSQYDQVQEWTDKKRLSGEKETLGLYLTGHPIDEYVKEIRHFVRNRVVDLQPGRDKVKIAGLIVALRVMKNKRGDKMGFITLDDRSGRIEVSVFAEVFTKHQHLLIKDTLVVVEAEISIDDYSGSQKGVAKKVFSLIEARSHYAKELEIVVNRADCCANLEQRLQQIFTDHNGQTPISIQYEGIDARAKIRLGDQWQVSLSDELLEKLRGQFGKERVNVLYG